MVITFRAVHSWFVHQLDVNNVFLHGDLQEDVYMTLPPGITSSKPNLFCKLIKSLYGFKQASHKWHEKLILLLTKKYKQASSYHSLFTKQTGNTFNLLLVYVDDIVIAGNSMAKFDHISPVFQQAFQIKNLCQLKYYLGLEVAHSSQRIKLCQEI